MQPARFATVRTFSPDTWAATALTDAGELLELSGQAVRAGGALLLRPGQRVRLHPDPPGAVTAVTLAGFGAPA